MNPRRTSRSRARTRYLTAALAVATMTTAACAPSSSSATDKTLTMAISNNPSSLDPQAGPSGTDHVVLYPLYDTLIDFNPATLKPTPGLASAWSFPDRATLKLTLRKGLKFSDGTRLDAKAVKASLDRYKTQTNAADLANVKSVDAPDATTVVLHERDPDSSLLLVLADRAGMIVSPKAAKPGFAQHPVGAGPFRLVRYNPGDRVVLERNPYYWQRGKPYLNRIEMRVIVDPKAAANALQSGQVDFASDLDPNDLPQLQRDKQLKVEKDVGMWFDMIYFNLARKPLSDVKVRQAINLALDRKEIIAGTVNGEGEPAYQPVPSEHWAFDPSGDNAWPHDLTKAKQLMKAAGYAGGTSITLVCTSSPQEIRRNEIVKAELAKIGINVHITPMDTNQGVHDYFEAKKFDAAQWAWSGRPDPGETFSRLFAKDSYQNPGEVAVPGLDGLLKKAVATDDLKARATAYAAANRAIVSFAPYAPLYFRRNITAYDTKVQGYTPSLLGKPKVAFVKVGQ